MSAKSQAEVAILAQLRKLRTDARCRAKTMSSQDQRRHAANLDALAAAIEGVLAQHTNPGRRYATHETVDDHVVTINPLRDEPAAVA